MSIFDEKIKFFDEKKEKKRSKKSILGEFCMEQKSIKISKKS